MKWTNVDEATYSSLWGADSPGYTNNGYIKSVTSPPVGCKEGVCKILGDYKYFLADPSLD